MISRLWMVVPILQCETSSPKRPQILSLDIKGRRSGPSLRWWDDPCSQYVPFPRFNEADNSAEESGNSVEAKVTMVIPRR